LSNELFESIRQLIQARASSVCSENQFNKLALDVFRHQISSNPICSKLCSRSKPAHWREIPLLTVDLFKRHAISCSEEAQIAKIWHSSGTTKSQQHSKHYVSDRQLELYQLSLWKSFSEAMGISQASQVNYIVLAPSPAEMPNSSLIYMFEQIRQKLNSPSDCYMLREGKLQVENLQRKIESSDLPVLLVGTAFAFVYLIDSGLPSLQLPAGSQIMETGGFKGKTREISKEELYQKLGNKLNLKRECIIGQYGMSELGSQYYDTSSAGQKACPPWARVRVLDPKNLEREVKENETGILCHYDLSNLDSLSFIMSGDIGIKRSEGHFELIGRISALSSKGCSLQAEEYLENN